MEFLTPSSPRAVRTRPATIPTRTYCATATSGASAPFQASPPPWPDVALDPDCDDDGLLDGIEVVSTKTDPYDWDTDGDGWSDGTEVSPYGTDPLDASDKPSGYPPGHPKRSDNGSGNK